MNIIMNDLINLMDPHYIEVWGNILEVVHRSHTNYGRPDTKYI